MFGVLTAIALGNFGILLWAERNAAEQQDRVLHTHNVLNTSSAFLGHLRDAETGQRGFLLTQQPEYLEPYHIGVARARSHFERLNLLIQDNPNQQYRLEGIQQLMAKKFAELGNTVQFAQQDRRGEALAIVNSGDGKQIMDDLRDQIRQFDLDEEALLELREAAFEVQQRNLRVLFGVETLSLMILIIGIGFYIQKTVAQPITRLTRSASTFGTSGDVELIPQSGDDKSADWLKPLMA